MKVLGITKTEHLSSVHALLYQKFDYFYNPGLSSIEMTNPRYQNFDVDAIFTNPNKQGFVLNEITLSKFHNLKVICTASTGLNHIDLEWVSSKGIDIISLTHDRKILNRIPSTAELAFGFLISSTRNMFSSYSHLLSGGNWDWEPFMGNQLSDLKVGIVGLGRLGSMMKSYCDLFGIESMYCDPAYPINSVPLKDLFEWSDVISLHIHSSPENKRIINKELFDVSSNLILINTSRGDIVNEEDLVSAIRDDKVKTYCTDVLADEFSNIKFSPILNYAKLNPTRFIITPHLGGSTYGAQRIAYTAAVNKLINWKEEHGY